MSAGSNTSSKLWKSVSKVLIANQATIILKKGEKLKGMISSIILVSLFLSLFALTFNIQPAKASGTIYIRADGSVDPPTANITTSDYITYIFTDNNYESIVVERNNITIDGAGYTLQGSGNGYGFNLTNIHDVTIKNTNVKNFYSGITLVSSSNHNSISRNNITNSNIGIDFFSSSGNIIFGNNITENKMVGINLESSSSNVVSGNDIKDNYFGIWLLYSTSFSIVYHNSFINNTGLVTGVPEDLIHNAWDNGVEGNYWSDYAGVDAGGDGIGDSSYIIDGLNRDNYPLMSPYIAGDYNHDGIVNMTDVNMVRGAWQSRIGNLNYNPHVDFNMDEIINIKDASIIGATWQRHP